MWTGVRACVDLGSACGRNAAPPPALSSVLALSPGDEDALRCKVAAQMQLSEFGAALALISKPPLAGLPLALEKAGAWHLQPEQCSPVPGSPMRLMSRPNASMRARTSASVHAAWDAA